MKPNSILALAVACAATNPLLMRDLERMQPRPVRPQTKADLERIETAQMKRLKKQLKRALKQPVISTVTDFNYDLSSFTTGHTDNVPMHYANMPVVRMHKTKPLTMQDLAKIKDAMVKDEMVLISTDKSCDFCTDPDGASCCPQYGLAPHTHAGNHLGETKFLPKSDWPPEFEPDPDCDGFGTWHCPECGA